MEAWMVLANPGPEHAELRKAAGTWSCACKSWEAPGAEPRESTGRSVQKMVLGDRFLMQEYEGDMMGAPFQGIGFTGFDNATRKYEAVWMDSMGTGIMRMTGTETEKGKAWVYHGSFFGPGGAEYRVRHLMRKVSDDEFVLEIWCDMGQGDMKCMEMTYTRAK